MRHSRLKLYGSATRPLSDFRLGPGNEAKVPSSCPDPARSLDKTSAHATVNNLGGGGGGGGGGTHFDLVPDRSCTVCKYMELLFAPHVAIYFVLVRHL